MWVATVLSVAPLALSQPVLFGVEIFAGEGELAGAFCQHVGPFEQFELLTNPAHDALDPEGFKLLMQLILRIGKGGHVHLGTPCSSWIFLARSQSRRSLLQPQGPPAPQCRPSLQRYLKDHNALADITGSVVRMACALGLTYSVEQPRSSLLWSYPPVLAALAATTARNIPFFMSAFQGDSPKPLSMRGNAPWLVVFKEVAENLHRRVGLPEKRLATRAAAYVTGRRAELKRSSAYTAAFGMAMSLCFLGHSSTRVEQIMHEHGFA